MITVNFQYLTIYLKGLVMCEEKETMVKGKDCKTYRTKVLELFGSI